MRFLDVGLLDLNESRVAVGHKLKDVLELETSQLKRGGHVGRL